MADEQTTTTETTTAATETAATETVATTTSETQEQKPYLGGGEHTATQGEKPAETQTQEPQKEFGEDDYVKGITKDEALLGKEVTLDEGYIKAMAPVFKAEGISPEQANKLANAFAKAQMDSAREQLQARREYFEKMKQESIRKYNENDWKQINAAIDANFKVGGVMNHVIRNSELGADPEFLAFLHKAGAAVKTDGVAGAAAGAGEGTGDANTFNGISSMW